MERTETIRELSEKITNLAAMHVIYRMDKTQGFSSKKNDISNFIRCHQVNVNTELDPLTRNLYRRYFE